MDLAKRMLDEPVRSCVEALRSDCSRVQVSTDGVSVSVDPFPSSAQAPFVLLERVVDVARRLWVNSGRALPRQAGPYR